MSLEKKWTRMTAVLTASSLLLTTPWYLVSSAALFTGRLFTGRPSHHEWAVMTSLLAVCRHGVVSCRTVASARNDLDERRISTDRRVKGDCCQSESDPATCILGDPVERFQL